MHLARCDQLQAPKNIPTSRIAIRLTPHHAVILMERAMAKKSDHDENGSGSKPRALTISRFCEAYDVSRATVWRRIKDGHLRSMSLSPGGKRLILLEGLEPPPPSVEPTAA